MNSECHEYQKNIPALLLGDLSAEDRKKLEAHLATCSHCRSESESYAMTVRQLESLGEEPVPHHFFVYPEERAQSPIKLFRQIPLGWTAALASAAVLMFAVGIAAISGFQVQADSSGWAVSFGRSHADLTALRKDILQAVENQNQKARSAWIQEMRMEMTRSVGSLDAQQKAQFIKALARMDSRTVERIANSEGQMRDDTRKLISDLYRVMAQERARDLEAINLRFDSTDANNAIKARQTNEILGTLIQVADLKLR